MRVNRAEVECRLVLRSWDLELQLLLDVKVHNVWPVVNHRQVNRTVALGIVEPWVGPELKENLANLDVAVLGGKVQWSHGEEGGVLAIRVEGIHLNEVSALLRIPDLGGMVLADETDEAD